MENTFIILALRNLVPRAFPFEIGRGGIRTYYPPVNTQKQLGDTHSLLFNCDKHVTCKIQLSQVKKVHSRGFIATLTFGKVFKFNLYVIVPYRTGN